MASAPQEDVLVVPRALFDRLGAFQGFCGDTAAYLPASLIQRRLPGGRGPTSRKIRRSSN